jgi:hypothetical protein
MNYRCELNLKEQAGTRGKDAAKNNQCNECSFSDKGGANRQPGLKQRKWRREPPRDRRPARRNRPYAGVPQQSDAV